MGTLPLPDDQNGCYDAPAHPVAMVARGKLWAAFVTTSIRASPAERCSSPSKLFSGALRVSWDHIQKALDVSLHLISQSQFAPDTVCGASVTRGPWGDGGPRQEVLMQTGR